MNLKALLKYINLVLRGLTILLKFILTLILVKSLSVSDYGQFSLIQSTIIILTFVVGVDYYNYSHREILKSNLKNLNVYVSQQLYVYIFTYLFLIPILYVLIRFLDFGEDLFYVIFFLVVCEHLSQELYRILIILNKTLNATMILFLRSGFWVFVLWLVESFDLIKLNLSQVLIFWLVGVILSIFYGLMSKEFILKKVSKKNIFEGLKHSIPFFLASILFKLLEFSGRYFLSFFQDKEAVGVFSFFTSYSNILYVFVHTLVLIEFYPKLVSSKNNGEDDFKRNFSKFKGNTFRFSIVALIILFLSIKPLFIILENEVFDNHLISFVILIISTFIFTISFVYHYALYTYSKDNEILYSMCFCLIINTGLSFLIIPKYSVLGASLVHLVTMLMFLFFKRLYWSKTIKK